MLEIATAKEHWRIITAELGDRQFLAVANGQCGKQLRERAADAYLGKTGS